MARRLGFFRRRPTRGTRRHLAPSAGGHSPQGPPFPSSAPAHRRNTRSRGATLENLASVGLTEGDLGASRQVRAPDAGGPTATRQDAALQGSFSGYRPVWRSPRDTPFTKQVLPLLHRILLAVLRSLTVTTASSHFGS